MPNNYDEVVKKNKKYLTNAQVKALATASKQYEAANAGSRAGALSEARQQYDAGYRGLQNMGLAGNPNAAPASGEVPRLQTQIKTPLESFNQRLRQVENQRLSALGSAYKKQTIAQRAAAYAARQKQLAQQQAAVDQAKASINAITAVTNATKLQAEQQMKATVKAKTAAPVAVAASAAKFAAGIEQKNKELDRLRAAAQVLGTKVDNAFTQAAEKNLQQQSTEATGKANITKGNLNQKTGDMHTIDDNREAQKAQTETAKAKQALTEFTNKNNYGYDADANKREYEAAQKRVNDLMAQNKSSYAANSPEIQQAIQARDIAKLKMEDPLLYASYVVIEDPKSDMATRQKAADNIMQTYDITKQADTRSDEEYAADKKKEKKVAFWLSVLNDKDADADQKKAAEKGLKSYDLTPAEAKEFVDQQAQARTKNAEYEYYKNAMMNSLTYAGKKPAQPVNEEETDQLYRAVNQLAKEVDYNDPYLRDDIPLEEIQVGETYVDNRLKYLTEDEINAYNYIYETEGLKAANQYIKDNEAMRNVRAAAEGDKRAKELVNKNFGTRLGANLMSIAANTIGNVPAMVEKLVTGAYNIVGDNMGNRNALWIDTSDRTHEMANFATGIRSETSRRILENNPGTSGQVYNFLYQGGMSMADSAVAMGFAYCGAPTMVDVMFFSSAGNEAYKDAMERGASQEQALAAGVLSGAAEAIFEHASIENFLNLDYQGKGRFIRNMLSQAGVEGSEEFNTEIANILTDAFIMEDKSSFNLEVQELMKSGMSKEDAERKALVGQVKNVGMAALGGFASGLGFGIFGAVPNAASQISTGREAKRTGVLDNYIQRAALLGGDAQQMANEVKESSKVSDRLAGALVQTVNKQVQESIASEGEEASPEKGAAMQTIMTGDKLTTNGAKSVMDTLGADTVKEMGYDTSSPSAFAKSYNERLTEYGVAPKAQAPVSEARQMARGYADTRRDIMTHATISETARAKMRQGVVDVQATAAKADSANRVWANPEQGMKFATAEGNMVTPLPGNMTAVARAEQERTGFKVRTQATKGNVTYAVAGMEAREGLSNEQKYNEIQKGLTKEARRKAKLYEALADALGVKMIIHDVMTGTNGFIDENGNMHVVLSGKQSVLRVAAHELTHLMKDNAATEYADMRKHLIREVGQEKFDRMIRQKAKEYGIDLSTEKGKVLADDEVCAELCERMLSNEEALERFAEKDTAAAKTLKEHLVKILNAIKDAFKHAENRNFGESWSDLIKSQDTIESWITGLQKAITNAEQRAVKSQKSIEAQETAKDGNVRHMAEGTNLTDSEMENYVGFVSNALEGSGNNKKPSVRIGKVAPAIISGLRRFGVYLRDNAYHEISDNNIRHIRDDTRHGFETEGPHGITDGDVYAIPYIIANADVAYYRKNKKGEEGVLYVMNENDSTYYVEGISSSGVLSGRQMLKAPLGTIPDDYINDVQKEKALTASPDDLKIPGAYVLDATRSRAFEEIIPSILGGRNTHVTYSSDTDYMRQAAKDIRDRTAAITAQKTAEAGVVQQENRVRYMVDTTIGEGLLEPVSDQRFQQLSAKSDSTYLVTNRTDLEKHVRNALTGDKKANIEIGVLPRDAAIKINEDIPNLPASFNGMLLRPYLQYAVEVSYDSMRHLRNEHGFTENEVVDYVLRIPDVLLNHDSVHFSWFEMHGGRQAGIRFKSSTPNGFNVVYELVSKKRNVLQLKTDYEKVIGPVYPAKSQMRSGVTSETASILALDGSIAEARQESNTPRPYSLDTDAIRTAFTTIDRTPVEKGLEQLKNLTPGTGLWALKDISRFLDGVSGGDKDLRNTLHDIFEKPHSEATGRYANGVARMQQRVMDIARRAGVVDDKGKHFDSKKSAAIQNIGEGFSNTWTDLKVKVYDAEHVTVQAYDPDTGKLCVSEKDYTLQEFRKAYGTNNADRVWDDVFKQAETAQETGGQAGWIDEKVNTRPYTLADLQTAFPNDWQKLERAANEFRDMYDEYIRDQNNMLSTIYPIESEYESVDKLQEGIEKKEKRLADHKAASADRLAALQAKLAAKEAEIAGKKRTDTKAYQQLSEQANRIRDQIESAQAEIAEYEAHVREELAKMNALKAEIQNEISHGGGDSLKRMHRLQYRSDYFHHFQEMTNGIQNLKAIFTDHSDIAPAIVGKSDQTKAKTKFAGFFQKREGANYTADAINGMLRYGQMAEYKLAFDPLAAYLRDVTKQIRELDKSETNRDNLIRYIEQWTNAILGKSHTIDRAIIDSGFGFRSKVFKTMDWINSRVIQNTLLWNMRSALVQASNMTNAKGIVTSNLDWLNGLRSWALARKGDEAMASIMSQSNFLASRYMDNLQLTDSKLKSAKAFAGWMLGALDEFSCKATWWAAYTQYNRNPNAAVIKKQNRAYESAVDYADDVCRRTHAGRGVGELAPAMTSRVVNLVAPFQVEVNNTWQLLKDNVKQRNYLGLLSTGVSVFVFNTIFEAIVGSTPLGFDFMRAVFDIVMGFVNDDPDDDDDDYRVTQISQRLAGELAGGLPFASQLVGIVGQDLAKKILGEDTDVTRYGNTQIGLSAVENTFAGLKDLGDSALKGKNLITETNFIADVDDLLSIIMPMGGKQLARTAEGIRTVAQGYSSKVDKEGNEKIQFITDSDIGHMIQAALFGKWSLTEASEYFGEKRIIPSLIGAYDGPKSSLGKTVDAKEYKAALETGIDGHQYFSLKEDLKQYTAVAGKRSELMEHDLTPDQKAQLDVLLFTKKDQETKAEGAIVYQKNSDGEWEVKADYSNPDMFALSEHGDKKYSGTLEAMEKTGLPQDQAALAADMWDRTKDAGDRKAEFRKILMNNKDLTVEQKEALDRQYCATKNTADYSDPELYDLSVSDRTQYEKAKEAKSRGVDVKTFTGLYEKQKSYTGDNRAAYMRREIMNSDLSAKQKEQLDDLLISDKGFNPDYSSNAWFEVSMLGKSQYEEARKGAEIGLKPEVYLDAYQKSKTINGVGDDGRTHRNLKKKRVKEYLDSLPVSAPVYSYLYTAVFGYK